MHWWWLIPFIAGWLLLGVVIGGLVGQLIRGPVWEDKPQAGDPDERGQP